MRGIIAGCLGGLFCLSMFQLIDHLAFALLVGVSGAGIIGFAIGYFSVER